MVRYCTAICMELLLWIFSYLSLSLWSTLFLHRNIDIKQSDHHLFFWWLWRIHILFFAQPFCQFKVDIPLPSNIYYISMHILIYIHRTLHARVMRRDHKLNFKNCIKSLDELAETDTLIMDDYFFMDKIFNTDDFCYILNE